MSERGKKDRENAAEYATLMLGIIIMVILMVEYIRGEIEGTKLETGIFFVGMLLIIRPTTLVDIANVLIEIFKKDKNQ